MKFTSAFTFLLASAACWVGTTEASLRGGAGPGERRLRETSYCTGRKVAYGSEYTIQQTPTEKYLCANPTGRKVNFYSDSEAANSMGDDWMQYCKWEAQEPDDSGNKPATKTVAFKAVARGGGDDLGDNNWLRADPNTADENDCVDAHLGQSDYADFRLTAEENSDCTGDVQIVGHTRKDDLIKLAKQNAVNANFNNNGQWFIVSEV